MDIFFKTVAAVMISVVLCLILGQRSKDMWILLAVASSIMILLSAFTYLQPILSLIQRLQELSGINNDILEILIKAVGISLLGEIVCMVCSDTGNAAMGKSVQILTTVVILWVSIPLITGLLDTVGNILSKV